jgi:hypothetical protein
MVCSAELNIGHGVAIYKNISLRLWRVVTRKKR